MKRHDWVIRAAAILVTGAFQMTGAVFGQSAPGGFSLSGLVLDPSHASVPGASVRLHRSDGTAEQATVTGDSGEFRFEKLAQGNYQVEVSRKSFKTVTVRVAIRNRDPGPLRIILAIAELKETIVASGSPDVVTASPADNRDSLSLERKEIKDLPILDQDIIGGISRFLDSGAVGSGGITLVVDGLQTSSKGVSASAIQEVKINQNPYSAEFARPGRGRIEITTKAGASEYHGSMNFLFRDYHLDARNAFAQTRPPEQRRIFEGSLTGPIGDGKKSSFLVTGNHETENLQAVVYAETSSGLVRQNMGTPQGQSEFTARVNHQFGKKHTVSVRYEFTKDYSRNDGVGGFTLPEAGADTTGLENHLYYNHRTVFSTKLVNEFVLRFGSELSRTHSLNPGRTVVVEGAFTGGGAQSDRRATQNRMELAETLFWTRGRHSFKAGVNLPNLTRRGVSDRSNFDGTYSFSSLNDYALGLPFSFQSNRGDPHLAFMHFEFGAFVQDDFRVLPNLSFALGLRYDLQNYVPDHNNYAPRLSFAYSPDRKRKTVFRGGAGYFYDKTGAGAIGDALRYDGQRLLQIIISRPSYPDPLASGAVTQIPVSVVRFASGVRSPYSLQYGAGVERQLYKSTTIALSYVETRGVKLFRSRDVNAPLAPLYLRPDPLLGRVREIESSAASKSRSLDITFRGNVTRFFTGTIQYAAGRAYNNAAGINSMPADNYDLSGEWSRAEFDERHRFNMLGTFKFGNVFKLGASLAFTSGRPYTRTLGLDVNHDGIASDRPPGVKRNTLQGPGSATLDLRWSRDFHLNRKEDGSAITLGWNVFNALNRVNYSGYVGNLSSPFFGKPVASRPARRMQITLAFEF